MKTYTVGIHRGPGFSERWAEALGRAGVNVRWLDLLSAQPLDEVAACDGVMWHWAHSPQELRWVARPLLRVIETVLNKPVFPHEDTAWHYDDKIAQAYYLQALGAPIPQTLIFWRKAEALKWALSAPYPWVAKLSTGAGSSNVKLVKDARSARKYIEQAFSPSGLFFLHQPRPKRTLRHPYIMTTLRQWWGVVPYLFAQRYPPLPRDSWMPQKNYAMFQEFIPGNDHDTRVTVIGRRAFAFRRFNRPNDFRASGSGLIDWDPTKIERSAIELAFECTQRIGAQSLAYDLLKHPATGKWVIVEISYCYLDEAVFKCPGHWDDQMNWHEGSMWPEEAQVEDFLNVLRNSSAPIM